MFSRLWYQNEEEEAAPTTIFISQRKQNKSTHAHTGKKGAIFFPESKNAHIEIHRHGTKLKEKKGFREKEHEIHGCSSTRINRKMHSREGRNGFLKVK